LSDEVAYKKGVEVFIPSFEKIKEIFEKDKDLRNHTMIIVSNASKGGVSGAINHSSYFDTSDGTSQMSAFRQSIYRFVDGIFSATPNDILYFSGQKANSPPESIIKACGSLMPCLHGSDAHSNNTIFEPYGQRYCWVKSDPTFEGLWQCVYQPSERVYIGTIPAALDREQKNKRSNVSRISVKRVENPKYTQYEWLNFTLELNAGLVAIIGNKGSGKSALSDIIGHLCECKTMKNASFLNNNRFRRSQSNYSVDYDAIIAWGDNHNKTLSLADETPTTTIESAQYLPQKYIEDICNDIGSAFQSEIDRVIFSYVDETELGSARNLIELVESKSKSTKLIIKKLQDEIDIINARIIKLEEQQTTDYRNNVTDNIKHLRETLQRHIDARPIEVLKPMPKESDSAYDVEISEITKKIENLEEQKTTIQSTLSTLNATIDDIASLLVKVESLHSDVVLLNTEISELAIKYALSDVTGFSEDSPKIMLSAHIKRLQTEKKQLLTLLNGSDNIAGELIAKGIIEMLEDINKEKDALVSSADKEEKAYQKYLSDCKEWEVGKTKIVGDSKTEKTLEYFEAELSFLNNELTAEYQDNIALRDKKLVELFNAKMKIVGVYEQIYNPIESEIEKLLGSSGEDISFAAEIQLKTEMNLADELLSQVKKSFSGKYGRNQNAESQMDRDIRNTDFGDIGSILNFTKQVMEVTNEDIDKSEKKIVNKRVFYNLLYSLDYINIAFRLKVGGRNLEELSPGERGIVLLVFFLALSKDSSPIIIDQPEDNLDNQSVFDKLVPCICEAKKKRQVIIVTHNPNIAIACDAEQIISCKIDKTNNAISYYSGAIESVEIKKNVVDILEGTMPAFELRKRKYVME